MQPPPFGNQPPLGAAPGAEAYGPPNLHGETPASFAVRAAARFIDTVVGSVVSGMATAFGGVVVRAAHLSGASYHASPLLAAKISISLVGPLLYHAISESMSGATVGKLLCGLRVVTEDSRPAPLTATLIRSAAYYIDAMCFALPAYFSMKGSSLQQRLGDKWAHTVVIRSGPSTASVPLHGIAIGLAVLVASTLLSVLTF